MKSQLLALFAIFIWPSLIYGQTLLPDSIESKMYKLAINSMDASLVIDKMNSIYDAESLGDPALRNAQINYLTESVFASSESIISNWTNTLNPNMYIKVEDFFNYISTTWGYGVTISFTILNATKSNNIFQNNDSKFLYSFIDASIETTIKEEETIIFKSTTRSIIYFKFEYNGHTKSINTDETKIYQILPFTSNTNYGQVVKSYIINQPKQIESKLETNYTDLNSKTGNLNIITNPSGATITMDGNPDFHKTSPFFGNGYTTGLRKIHITKDNYTPLDTTIIIKDNNTNLYSFKLIPQFGFVTITSNETYNAIYIDGTLIDDIYSDSILLPLGSHKITIEKSNYHSVTQNIEIQPGTTTPISITLKPKSGFVEFKSNVESMIGAHIWIDNKHVGVYPLQPKELPIGRHYIYIDKDDLAPFGQSLQITEGKTTVVNFELFPYKNITINVSPEDSKVFVNNEKLRGKSPYTYPASIGSLNIKVVHEFNNSIDTLVKITKETDYINIELVKKEAKLRFDIQPNEFSFTFYDDGVLIPASVRNKSFYIRHGDYKLVVKSDGYFTKRKNITINEANEYIKLRLFPNNNIWFLTGSFGYSNISFNIGAVFSSIYLGFSYGKILNDHFTTKYDYTINATDSELQLAENLRPVGKYFNQDSTSTLAIGKIGLLSPWPIPMMFVFGGGVARFNLSQQVYEGIYDDWIGEDWMSPFVSQGDRVTSNNPNYYLSTKFCLTGGLWIPIRPWLLLSAEYLYMPDTIQNYKNTSIGIGFWF